MGERNVVNPATGEKGSVPESKLARARAAGARDMSAAEATAVLEERKHDGDIVGRHAAQAIGKVRGVGEAFGLPTDALITAGAQAVGKEEETRNYLSELQKWHPYASGLGELSGQVAGTVAGGELIGGGRLPSIAGRIAGGAARAGLENTIINSTHDINEASLGHPDANGEKILAGLPKHFAMGAIVGAGMGAVGEGVAAGWEALAKKAPGALTHASDAAIGREFGGGAELGAEIRGKVGGVPRSAAEVTEALSKEQAAFRAAAKTEAEGAKDALIGRHVTEAGRVSAKQEAARLALSKESKAALDDLASQHTAAREALTKAHTDATEAAAKLAEERAVAHRQIGSLAADLDKVKGAELPNAKNIMRAASEAFQAEGTLTPPSPNAVRLFSEWTTSFNNRFSEPGSLTFTELRNAIKTLDTMEVRQRVVSGWGSDPEVKKAFDALKRATKEEFDRASEQTAASLSEAKNLSVSRVKENALSLDKAHAQALDAVDSAESALGEFAKKSAFEMRAAEKAAIAQSRGFEKAARLESRALSKSQLAAERGLPKPSKATPVDTLLGRVRSQPNEPAGIAAMAPMGALLSLLHGNVAGAAMSAAGGLAANAARAQGNLLAARTLSSLSEAIAASDGQIARLAGRAVGKYVRQAPEVPLEDKRPKLTFEKASQAVRNAQANPLIIATRVQAMAEPWAQQAPGIYSSLLASSMRMQAFLASKLPPARIDPYSLTPHLEVDDLSDTEKYEFIEYASACRDPMQAMKDVIDGAGSPEQVEAVAAVYPRIYAQMQTEVMRRIGELQKPLEYERAVNIGTLLQIDTQEVMTSEFQSMLADMYTARSEDENSAAKGSGAKPRGVNSRLSKSMASESQQMQMPDS